MSTDFAGEAEEDIAEDSKLEGPWTRWGPRVLAKQFYQLTENLVWHLNACLEGETPWWMTKGRTGIIQKDKSKGNEASNYRPITCLPLT